MAAPTNSYRWATNHISQATITGSDNYVIELQALASDQSLNKPWMVSERTSKVKPARRVENQDRSLSNSGGYEVDIVFPYLTYGMLAANDTALGLSETVQSHTSTVFAPDATGTWDAYQGIIQRPREGETMDPAPGGWANVVYKFVKGVAV